MKFVKCLIIFCFLLVATAASTMATDISGKVVNGLRILTPEEVSLEVITLYRGDYVVFPTVEGDSKTLVIEGLKINHIFPAEKGKKNYVKFKKTGLYPFNYGGIQGKINVVEYDQASYRAVSAKEAREIIANIAPLLLDVRTPAEYYMGGFIEGSMLLPVQVIQREYTKLHDYKDKPILIYCATGNRSTVAAKILIDNGFKNIYNMRYGIAEWKHLRYPVGKNVESKR